MSSEGHAGFSQDQRRRDHALTVVSHNSTLIICERCGGTGNELFAMYRQCSDCDGNGYHSADWLEADDDSL